MTPAAVGDARRSGRRVSTFDYSRVAVTFESGDDDCAGWLYRPDRPADPPVVVMAGGLALPRTALRPVAERFAAAGYAAFLFDYRGVGDSEGAPRNLVSPDRGVADWTEAVACVRGLDGVDARSVVCWGHSLGGAYALRVAAADPRVAAVVAVAPVLSGRALLRARPLPALARLLGAGVRDRVQSLLPRVGPHTAPAAGDDGATALVADAGVRGDYRRLAPVPDVPARSGLALARFSVPVADVAAPTLFVVGGYDETSPPAAVEAAAGDLPDASVLRLPATHLGLLDDGPALDHALVFLDDVVD